MSTRASIMLKNIEEKVEFILPTEGRDEVCNVDTKDVQFSNTDSRGNNTKNVSTPKASNAVLRELLQTPRRSCRKSIKPTQDYEDIISKSLRSLKKHVDLHKEEDDENRESEIVAPKWTPAKVGRVSQKRSRKSRRTVKAKQIEGSENNLFEESDNCGNEVVEIKQDTDVEQFGKIENHSSQTEIENEKNKKNVTEHLNVINNYIEHKKNLPEVQEKAENALKDHNQSILLISEDSDGSVELVEKPAPEHICIVYERNISNSEMKNTNETETSSHSIKKAKNGDKTSFGCYLNSKEVKLSDLGLKSLKEDEEDKVVMNVSQSMESVSQVTEEMPSLIVYDEDEVEVKTSTKMNETFESNANPTEVFMETLQLSDDDGETPQKPSVFGNFESEILNTPKELVIKTRTPCTPKALLTTPKGDSNRKPVNKPVRISTPYINRKNFKFSTKERGSVTKNTPCTNFSDTTNISITTLEPKEIVLRGIRKRSLSMCIDGHDRKGQNFLAKNSRVVSFYSPANQTATIDDMDIKITKSLKKQKPSDKESLHKFVTTRRKRSISLDEIKNYTSLLPRPVANPAGKKQNVISAAKPLSRTKLPNFAAIHEKQFQKMENLVEHVNRKQERSKTLINSATKLKQVSAQKNFSVVKNRDNILNEKPKALKKIDLGNISLISKPVLNSTASLAPNKGQDVSDNKRVVNLPEPRLHESRTIKMETISRRPLQKQQINKHLKLSQTEVIENTRLKTKTAAPSKPPFNLSTSLMFKPSTSSSTFIENANTSHMASDKMSSRLQRHIDLFKGRSNISTKTGGASRKNDVILKGVRSNRRFELQMQHRKNLEQ